MEIERKFLVKGDFRSEVLESRHMVQGYLSSVPERTVRVRVAGDKGYITVKGSPAGISRFEWEKEIPSEEASQLLCLAEPGVIDKTRHLIPATDGIHTWEVDEFHADNEGLIVAEIELGREDEPFDRPEWLAEEVSGREEYYNSALSKRPYKFWK